MAPTDWSGSADDMSVSVVIITYNQEAHVAALAEQRTEHGRRVAVVAEIER